MIPNGKTSAAKPGIKVGVLSVDDIRTACAYLRLVAPLNYLRARGQMEYLALCELANGRLTVNQKNIGQAQLVVVQRGMPAYVPYHVLRASLRHPSVKIVFELDDALTQVPADNPHGGYFQALRPQIEAYLRNADLVTVSTPQLKAAYSCYNDHIEVLANTIDTQIWLPLPPKPQPGKKITILFSGTRTHQNDLALIERAIELIIDEFGDGVEFLFWGNLPATLRHRPQIKNMTEFTPDYRQYVERMKRLAPTVDLALVPLEVTPFNRAKSNIKWLEYSACKVPAIFTDIEPYNQSVEHGKTGWLAANTVEAWQGAIRTLILDEDLRRGIAENAHQTVLSKHTLEANADLWRQAYEKALAMPPKSAWSEKPAVSIIIPTFNNLALTRHCLLALQKNTPAGDCEIIVVDNASTDGTVEFLKGEEQAGRLRAILNRENAGFARACNQGSKAAQAGLLLFLNNDTQVRPGWFDALAGAVRRPKTGIAGAKLLYADGRIQHAGIGFIGGVPDHPHRHAPGDAPEVNQFRELDMVTGACLLIRRELFVQLAGFDEAYHNGVEDADLCLRVRAAGWKVVYEPKAVVFHLEGQSAGRFNHVAENLKIFFERWGKSFDGQYHFIAPKPARTIAPKRSLLLATETVGGEKPLAVAWEGTFLDFGSLSYVNRQLTKCLAAQPGIDLSLVSHHTLTGSPADCPELQEIARRLLPASGKETQITVRHQWPPDWRRQKHGALVVIQPWEFGALPQDWVKASAHVDEFWVPSNYVRQVYIDSGVAAGKVFVVPNGVDAERYRMGAEPMALATQKKFRFLFVGGTIHRKGPDLLLEAYQKNFTAADDVCLVIKDFGGKSWYAGQTFENQIKAAQTRPDAPEILYLTEELSAEAMPGLYAACDCLVHPYRGEGFGLPVLEAMACGLPVIVTGGGATDDFAGEEHAYRVAARRQYIGSEISGQKLAGAGWLLEPDLSALGERMKWVVHNREEARRKGRAASDHVRQEWTWQRAAQLGWERLQKLRAHQPAGAVAPAPRLARQPITIKPPEMAKIGHLAEARELLGRKEFARAWQSTLAALARRPYHPEACLLLAEIAQAAGDADAARCCAKAARDMAPDWTPPKQFLKGNLRGRSKPEWLKLPAALSGRNAGAAPRVSVCLIARNEERFLSQCLGSVRALASQIVVVDTGSTDRTIEIAREFGAEVHSFPWCDDFSAARNAALEHATGDWILILDADEELMPDKAETLAAEIRAATVMGYRLPIIDRGREEGGCNYVQRLFRNAPGLYFVGRIHEQVFSTIQVRARQWGLKNVLGQTALLHHGYAAAVVSSRNKIERNRRLLERAVEEMPDEPTFLMNLGLELVRSGELEAGLDRYWEAFRVVSALPEAVVTPEGREALLTQLSTHLMSAKRFSDIVQLLQNPFASKGGLTASQHFCLGVAQMELRQHAEAAGQMRQCIAKRHRPALAPINLEILKAGPHHCLALCLCAVNDAEGAQRAFEAALATDPLSRPMRFDLARFHAAQGRTGEALKGLRQLAVEDPAELRVWEFGGVVALSRPEHLPSAHDWTAEALQHFPDDQNLLRQRAEALLLNQEVAQALPLWRRGLAAGLPRQRGAVVLCELLTGDRQYHFTAAEEPAISQEVVHWYRQCIRMGAHTLIHQLHERMDAIRLTLPAFVRVCEAAHRQARLAAA